MNNLLQLSALRHSVRSYTPEPVADSDLDYILQCARLAPSAVNRQPWRFIVCRSQEALSKVQACYNRDWFKEAPLVIVACICHDEEWIRPNDNQPHGMIDIAIATEHICLAAAERGLGTCWVCNFDTALCHQLLNLPNSLSPAVLIPLGHPSTTEIPEKNRKQLQDILQEI